MRGILCLQRSSYLLPASFCKPTYMQARSVARTLRSAVMAPAASLAAARSLTAALSSSTTARPSSDKVGSAAPVFSFDCRDFLLHAGSVFLCALVGLWIVVKTVLSTLLPFIFLIVLWRRVLRVFVKRILRPRSESSSISIILNCRWNLLAADCLPVRCQWNLSV